MTDINIDEIRNIRNFMISRSDNLMLIPDLPSDIKAELIEYRNELRNITDKIGKEWKTNEDVVFPEIPEKLRAR
jgi:hypothetical protein